MQLWEEIAMEKREAREEGLREGREEGWEKGREEGREEGIRFMVKFCIVSKDPQEEIMACARRLFPERQEKTVW